MATFFVTLFIIICVLLIVVVLLQKGRGGGLGAALGGVATSAFGTRTGDVFTWVTIVLTGLFLLLAIGTTLAFRPEKGQVDAPVFLPPQGEITEDVSVRMTVPGDRGNTQIRYTLDGSDPTEESAMYQKILVKVEPGTTVKARAYRPGYIPSRVVTARYAAPGEAPAAPPSPEAAPESPAAGEADGNAVPAEPAVVD